MASKTQCQIRHAKMRAMERFDLVLSNSEYQEMCAMIKHGKCKIIDKQSSRVSIHELDWAGRKLVVAYDKDRHTIITFLPNKNWFEVEN